jgi:Domain of unknown function (DUF4262)
MSPIDDLGEELARLHEDARREFQARTLAHIAEHGQSIVGVFGETREGCRYPSFAYTIGMTKNKLPEFIVFSLDHQIAQAVLNQMCDRAREIPYAAGFYDNILSGYKAALLPVRKGRADDYVVQATNLFDDVEVMQLVWPDQNGRFPWQKDYGVKLLLQPILGDWTVLPS